MMPIEMRLAREVDALRLIELSQQRSDTTKQLHEPHRARREVVELCLTLFSVFVAEAP